VREGVYVHKEHGCIVVVEFEQEWNCLVVTPDEQAGEKFLLPPSVGGQWEYIGEL